MQSSLPKVLHPLSREPILSYVLKTVFELKPDRVVVVVGFDSRRVIAAFQGYDVQFVEQKEQMGTGHAVAQTKPLLEDFDGDVLILCGDMPFIKASTLKSLMERHRQTEAPCTLLVLQTGESKDFGRIIRNERGEIVEIVESLEAADYQKTVDEYNAGVYCFQKDILFESVDRIDNKNSKAEYYLTDTIRVIVEKRLPVQSIQTRDAEEIFGINAAEDLKKAQQILFKIQRSPC